MPSLARLLCRFCAAMLLVVSAHAAGTAARPNVVIVMPDDVSFGDFSLYGADAPRTPNIDGLAGSSVRLTNFHVSPTCSPTRAALMTGRYNDATGVWHTVMGRYFLRPDEVTMPEVLRANGYRTALFGKWHLGDNYPLRPKDRGFEHVVMYRGGGADQQHNHWGNRNTPPAWFYDDDREVPLEDEDDGIPGAFATNLFTSRAIAFMRRCREAGEPFFAYVAYNVAHAPQDMPPDARAGIDAHTATVENLDKNVGRILAFLDEAKLADNTLVLFFTDNGMNSPRYRGGKSSHFEGGHRVPCFVRWPQAGLGGDSQRAREIDRLVSHIDVLPTLIDMLGLKNMPRRPKPAFHGASVKPLLAAPAAATAEKSRVLSERILVVDNQRMDELAKYRQAAVMYEPADADGSVPHRWRLTRQSEGQSWELYDVAADPKQGRNLAADPQWQPVIAKLSEAYESWWRDVSARSGEYVRPIIGSEAQRETCLYSHDWHADERVPFNHTMIATGAGGNGFNAVEFARTGAYRFDLRRWPREIEAETTATSALRVPLRDNKNNQPITGVALPIHSARLRVWQGDNLYADETRPLPPEADGVTFDVPSLPAGPACVQTWFFDAAGKEICGAYYTYVTGTFQAQ